MRIPRGNPQPKGHGTERIGNLCETWTGVHEPLAQRMGIDSARMPMSILAPADVAASACGVRPEALSRGR